MGGTSTDRSVGDDARSAVAKRRRPLSVHLRIKGTAFLAVLVACAGPLGLLRATPAFAASTTWDGSSSTSWGTSSNWSLSAVPGSGDAVTIPSAFSTPND